ncbi:MAG: OmpA family protein, partial [Pseudomonadota bacterium]
MAGAAGALIMLSACATTGADEEIISAVDTTRSTAAAPIGPIPGSQADLEQTAGHRVFYGYNQYTLTPQAQDVLARQAAWLKQYPEADILISGNCDERGTREYNLALGARRAEAARAYL